MVKGTLGGGEIRNQTKYGDVYWVDTTIVPLLNENKKPHRYVSIRNDITQNKIIEKKIKESEEIFRFITGNSSDLIMIIDREGKIFYASPSHEKLLKTELAHLNSLQDIDIVNDEDRSSIRDQLSYLLETKKRTTSIEFCVRLEEAVTIDVKMDINSIFDSDGEVRNFVLVTRDITEQKNVKLQFTT